MLIYKGFIKVSKDETFYPVSRIKSIKPNPDDSWETQVIFDDGKYVIFKCSIRKTIDMINGIQGGIIND